MKQEPLICEHQEIETAALHAAGAALARSTPFEGRRAARSDRPAKPSYDRRALAQQAPVQARRLLIENLRLILAAEKEDRDFAAGFRHLPLVRDASGRERVRVSAIATAYLDREENRFTEETCAAFLDGFQDVAVLEMSELWAFKPALQRGLLERIAAAPALWPVLLSSLRQSNRVTIAAQ